ncbi:MAG: riboflavin synthase [Sphaerospermopsis kisseleviana]|jgi:riboflavin synthase|uniref:Riboflavin synthase n=3 Tax=Sphaerospermopsis TaxID=752201 RepID=A0A480A550_9CYAN|nr:MULTISPECIES: riboflavin synthase [Sphaerospermopsis]BAZ83143.1 riboflavin synthase subunit alpha [Sphaerospermopsis kisseleviana NIES-73]MBC5797957.1 riboflavin synthase [Sphaerospermopsis sp. LEGE 00249]MBD2133598.1 riboflavin synthase [Sphaerospermopsis sp. FACHB-1094]MBD2146721.1 riboflavin synthase [Sphaerospermopsis sp. FACHB-1194]MBE9238147.1 riboflavin synthase [Sphaerospermopsis aphanizomenoides LEGE 00250]
MFTGLIQGLGKIKPLSNDLWQITFVSHSDAIMHDLTYGDSVAVDGVCLTVEEILKDGFIATASPETLRRTTLGREETQARYVNLETSLRVGGKVGGHFVMGHVDGMGELILAEQTATSWEMTFAVPEAIARYIVPKGSIAINGISLTVATYQPEHSQFTAAVIPLTYSETNLSCLSSGSWVNLEADILGKYVEKFISPGKTPHQEDITPAFLIEHGYL